MKKLIITVLIVLVVGLIAVGGYMTVFPHASSKVDTPYLTPEGAGMPLMVFVPVTNLGRPVANFGPGTLQVAMSIWGSPSDVVGSSLEGRQSFNSDPRTHGSGSNLVRIRATYFVPPNRKDDFLSNHLHIGDIACKRKYPVHVGIGWRRDRLEGEERFVIPPDKDIILAE